ncbi:MAG: hypothetical protein MdMp024_1228 [Bacteroidales bacterium]
MTKRLLLLASIVWLHGNVFAQYVVPPQSAWPAWNYWYNWGAFFAEYPDDPDIRAKAILLDGAGGILTNFRPGQPLPTPIVVVRQYLGLSDEVVRWVTEGVTFTWGIVGHGTVAPTQTGQYTVKIENILYNGEALAAGPVHEWAVQLATIEIPITVSELPHISDTVRVVVPVHDTVRVTVTETVHDTMYVEKIIHDGGKDTVVYYSERVRVDTVYVPSGTVKDTVIYRYVYKDTVIYFPQYKDTLVTRYRDSVIYNTTTRDTTVYRTLYIDSVIYNPVYKDTVMLNYSISYKDTTIYQYHYQNQYLDTTIYQYHYQYKDTAIYQYRFLYQDTLIYQYRYLYQDTVIWRDVVEEPRSTFVESNGVTNILAVKYDGTLPYIEGFSDMQASYSIIDYTGKKWTTGHARFAGDRIYVTGLPKGFYVVVYKGTFAKFYLQ